ncbi:cell wall-associated NlpC family hydrolase [Kribbella amoyensis]|uniref:Cell wall-associated NlpC family hydrolase n=1 Tax=Kribbella amoyensis TaxID=996641 RepID=A0A561BXT8_9ACTN|nr:NlpC/P60 family protein [Kribbella amoyensis]TWD83704.1 cell wall-associated NlpC family hydrolase [Kribbella amoyensis]
MQWKRARRSITTLALAFATAVAGAVMVASPPAYADGLANPSGTLTVECPGASAFVQVDWLGPNRVTIRWRLEDTGTATNISPVIRIQAVDGDGTVAPMTFPSGDTFFVLRGGNGHSEVGLKADWNPGNMADLNHLKVKVQNGTTDQGTSCTESRNIFNWSRIAYNIALSREAKGYRLGGLGPDFYDCSGLTLTSYNAIPLFNDFNLGTVRTAEEIYDWARTHTSPAKVYAKRVPRADAKVGDLFFYERTAANGRDITHVGFYAGNNTQYDALSPEAGIDTHDISSSYWTSRLVEVYRILGVSTDG